MHLNAPFALCISTLTTLISAHGIVTSPPARIVGTAMKAACGQQVTNNLQSNAYGDIQQLSQIGSQQKDFTSACDVSLCKGLQFADNTANVQSFTPGQNVSMKIDIQAKHTGVANVSVVDTATNKIVGEMLRVFSVYASTSTEIPKNQTDFEVEMPDVGSQCGEAGKCVLQWWWDSRESDQTYMSCVDFTM
jgi:predicted carbohydrate-binding protein with CBM5 and CBM33 domain